MPDYHKIVKKHHSKTFEFGVIYKMMVAIGLIQIIFGLTQNTPIEILNGLKTIITTPDTLITDYIALSNMGAAFVNSGILTLVFIYISFKLKQKLNGIHIAALFAVSGFALFGKNIMNVWFILIGVKLYAMYKKDNFSSFLIPAFFATSISPIVSELMFNTGLDYIYSIPIGIVSGIILGFIIPPIAASLINIHHGFNLYNIGFTSGMIGMVYISMLKSYGFKLNPKLIWSTGNNYLLGTYLIILFLAITIYGFIINNKSFKGYKDLLSYPGIIITDFIQLEGKGVTIINIGFMGLISTGYILLTGGDINGPTIGGIFTIAGFSAFGKHPKNILPIFFGIMLASYTKIFNIDDPSIQLAGLFATGLAPISGEFGPIWGIIAAIVHSSIVLNVGALHGGVNLYNNGFSAGLVAAVLIPLISIFKKEN